MKAESENFYVKVSFLTSRITQGDKTARSNGRKPN